MRPANIGEDIEKEFAAYARTCYPLECCAFVIDGKLEYIHNTHEDPRNFFALDLDDAVLMLKAQAFIHSHPDRDIEPSEADMKTQMGVNIPFGICSVSNRLDTNFVWWGDYLLDYPLEERPFIHGIFDCYSIIRSVYWQDKGVKLMDFPRNCLWWESEQDLYSENFEKAGFIQVHDLQPYDVILMRTGRVNKVNHAAVFMGGDKILHHLSGRASGFDSLSRRGSMVLKVVRYNV